MKCKYFGTDGIRDSLKGELMSKSFIRRVGYALGRYLQRTYPDQHKYIIIGRDTRESGKEIAEWLAEGLCFCDCILYDLGEVPTPAVSMLIDELHAKLGIVITASHNPITDNGIKLFNQDGYKLPLEEELLIETYIDETIPPAEESEARTIFEHPGRSHFINHHSTLMDKGCLYGWKIVVDTANGATSYTTPEVLRHFGAEVIQIGDRPNGKNINDGVGSEHPELMAKKVVEVGANLGIAHDGDGDRLILCDEHGSVLDGDEVLGILAINGLENESLPKRSIVATIQSNKGLDRALASRKGEVLRCDVGDRNVLYRMLSEGITVGGESSGHILFLDHSKTGDGLLAALQVMQIMLDTGRMLSDLRHETILFPKGNLNLKVREKIPLDTLENIKNAKAEVEGVLGDNGQLILRYSGTEAKLRIQVEATGKPVIENCLRILREAVEKDLEVLNE